MAEIVTLVLSCKKTYDKNDSNKVLGSNVLLPLAFGDGVCMLCKLHDFSSVCFGFLPDLIYEIIPTLSFLCFVYYCVSYDYSLSSTLASQKVKVNIPVSL